MRTIDLFEEMAVNDLTLIDALRDFLPLAIKHLKLPGIPKITLEKNIEKSNVPTFGRFTNEDDHVYVAINNRNPNDILRTLAHEMCHFKQRTEHQLSGGSWKTGSPAENQAHDEAGIIMREFNSKFPQYLRMKPVILPDGASSKHIDEKWSAKYKKSINCSNPKGFSQKAHCAGRKKHNESSEQSDMFDNPGSNFEHVASKRLKRILLSSQVTERDLAWALKHTQDANYADQDNEYISSKVLDAREEACDSAQEAFEQGDWKGALDAIREVWRI